MQRSNFGLAVFAANQIDDDPPQIGAGIVVEAAPALVKADEGLLSKIGSGHRITCQKAGKALESDALGREVLVEVGITPSKLHFVLTTPRDREKLRATVGGLAIVP